MEAIKICEKRNAILDSVGHILIEGGPGSGKTTIGLLKAKKIIDDKLLKNQQKIIFLSFARATISRVEEQAKNIVTKTDKKNIEINTYHGFAWSIIQSYGYLLKSHRFFTLITPPNLAAKIASIDAPLRPQFKEALLEREGIICFDLFSATAAEILEKSDRIRSIISNAYPFIIVDEFQDTDDGEWKLIKLLGKTSTLIALADLEQRIYEFRGASITRIPEFSSHFNPNRFDLGKENNRSTNTDIVQFADDLLSGSNKGKSYTNVLISYYPYYKDIKLNLKYQVINSIKRIKGYKAKNDWSIAILVKSKADTLSVSSYLTSQNLEHEVLIDPAGPALSANVIATLLEIKDDTVLSFMKLLDAVINHLKGRKGDKPSQLDLKLAAVLEEFRKTGKITGPARKKLVDEIKTMVSMRTRVALVGVPETDWLEIRKLFQNSSSSILTNVYEDARYIRLLNRGASLSEELSKMWRETGSYQNAVAAIDGALVQEHFSMTQRIWKGIIVMNIHKSKGKEFDEVIIWEEPYKPIVYADSISQDRLSVRVAITRAKSYATFMTPKSSPCILL